MAEISYEALPNAEKKRIARELRPSHTLDQLVELLHVGKKAVWNWTKDVRVDLRVGAPPKQVKTDEDFCHCSLPARDSHADSFCQRSQTCIYCTKPRRS